MRRLFLVLCSLVVLAAVRGALGQIPDASDGLPGIPNTPSEGRRRVSALARDDFRRNRQDVAEIRMLAENLMAGLNRDGGYIVDVNSIRAVERIEKLAKDVKGRLKR